MNFLGKQMERESWLSALFLKSGILGLGIICIFWVGWPQPPNSQDSNIRREIFSLKSSHSISNKSLNSDWIKASGSPLPVGDLLAHSGVVNINAGTHRQLKSLPGIGSVLASRIIVQREKQGRFTRVEDLVTVRGIGPHRYQKLLHLVSVE